MSGHSIIIIKIKYANQHLLSNNAILCVSVKLRMINICSKLHEVWFSMSCLSTLISEIHLQSAKCASQSIKLSMINIWPKFHEILCLFSGLSTLISKFHKICKSVLNLCTTTKCACLSKELSMIYISTMFHEIWCILSCLSRWISKVH